MTERAQAYRAIRRDGVLRVDRPETEWLSSGWNGGRRRTDCAYNVSVPEGWSRTDLAAYADERLERADLECLERHSQNGLRDAIEDRPPVLFTGVDLEHARGARCGSVTVYATAGISNPAALPMDPDSGTLPTDSDFGSTSDGRRGGERGSEADTRPDPGTVNLVVGTTRALADGALANLLAVAAEAKAATLLATTGFPGTTTDAIVVGHDPAGRAAAFTGSATPVGEATRACVRETVRASLRSRYDGDGSIPDSVADADHGTATDVRAQVFQPALEESEDRAQ
ncbi:adenosylcobinamide amidohydrolase [Natrarchaeobius chitinivorans]|uniref:Adenosylcobinamide amidohydrolase n=1 Tax=Natrarchaeobius chitinivorans TaxID=1679083 RepID=A0A3N6MKW9_NATCH|nr:adenosylcobinamide amidohydrolase [Natrarchaeobius chitinivorans]RQG96621.1 adenosylcobinamide amidohydrolase [Natrarchaeobius chitinivorans]